MSRRTEIALGRRFGASPAARERMRAANEDAVWTGGCQACGQAWKGTLKQLRERVHDCRGVPDGRETA